MLQSAVINDNVGDQEVKVPLSIFYTPQAKEELAKLSDASLLYYDARQGYVRFLYPTSAEGLRRTQ
jgi:hypothetical protein